MKIYSLYNDYQQFLACDDGDGMINLTKAISLYEAADNGFFDPVGEIDELIWDERFDREYLDAVMGFLAKHNLAEELAITGDFKYNPPVTPGKIIALGNNYHEHIKEMNQKVPEVPVLFGKWPSTVVGHGDNIEKPAWIGRMDYEAELAFIISRRAKNVPAEEAMNYIAGYTCLNDVSAREIQGKDLAKSLPWMPSKNFDTFCPMGPCVVLAEDVASPVNIDVKCRVNGELKQDGSTSDFIFDIPAMIAYITNIMTLEPGDVVTTGTPVGVGAIEPGDVVEIECGGIGVLSNTVVEAE